MQELLVVVNEETQIAKVNALLGQEADHFYPWSDQFDVIFMVEDAEVAELTAKLDEAGFVQSYNVQEAAAEEED